MSNLTCIELTTADIRELHLRYEAAMAREREIVIRDSQPGEYRDFQLSRLRSMTFERFEAKVFEIVNVHHELDLLLEWLGDVRQLR